MSEHLAEEVPKLQGRIRETVPESGLADGKHQKLRKDDERTTLESGAMELAKCPPVESGYKQDKQQDGQRN